MRILRIGVIGLGMVGEAVAYGLRRIGHDVRGFDVNADKTTHSYREILFTELVFICVPTPNLPDGRCDTSSVGMALDRLGGSGYRGLAVIKSTVPPGTTEAFTKNIVGLRLAFCPEFLRERARFSDFVENQELCIAGVFKEFDAELIRAANGKLPEHFVVMTPTEAELAKYFVNCFNGYRVNFANAFYDVCQAMGADYTTIKDAVTKRSGITPDYLTCNEQTRGFGGSCLPKDTKAFAVFVKALGLTTPLFEMIIQQNDRENYGDAANKRVA